MIRLFLVQTDKELPEIRTAVERRDGNALERLAHKLKGSIGSFGDQPASAAALRLELMGSKGEFAGAPQALVDLEKEVVRLREALAVFSAEDPPCAS